MKKTTSLMVIIAGLLLAGASTTAAQTPLGGKLFVGVNAGVQTQSHTLDDSGSLSIYNQTASWTTSQSIPDGPLFDFSVGYKVWSGLGIAVGYSHFSRTGTLVGSATIPNPVSFTGPTSQRAISETDAKRSDSNVYVVAMWFFPVTEKIDVAFAIGPSFIGVKQDLLLGDSQQFRENIVSAANAGTPITPVMANQSGTATGINIGVDARYMFTQMLGGGVFIRYNGGSVDLPDAQDLDAGGFQLGIGARLRF
jgi:opacity protein-like surface antigen